MIMDMGFGGILGGGGCWYSVSFENNFSQYKSCIKVVVRNRLSSMGFMVLGQFIGLGVKVLQGSFQQGGLFSFCFIKVFYVFGFLLVFELCGYWLLFQVQLVGKGKVEQVNLFCCVFQLGVYCLGLQSVDNRKGK